MPTLDGSSSETRRAGNWPHYDGAKAGLRNYWYPVLFAGQLRRRPRALVLCGERIVLVRDAGRVYGLHDRCPHRGVPLSQGRHAYPGLITCAYHGWCYDLASGDLVAALTDAVDGRGSWLVVVVGASKVGKSRALFEALRACERTCGVAKDLHVVAPIDGDALRALLLPGQAPLVADVAINFDDQGVVEITGRAHKNVRIGVAPDEGVDEVDVTRTFQRGNRVFQRICVEVADNQDVVVAAAGGVTEQPLRDCL